jgi:NAD-dependent SIR2 family protein deacetylase
VQAEPLAALLWGRRLAVLTGAGCSTESGIPDYRGPETLRRARNPLKAGEFLASADARRRYWARSLVAFRRFTGAEPNPAHRAIAELERCGSAVGLITQNVDRLHGRAGSRRVVELHGAVAEVRCLACSAISSRSALQGRLEALNPSLARALPELAPDGDADLPEEAVAGFSLAECLECGGDLRPNVVMFGENVAAPIVRAAFGCLAEADALLVVGSSLVVQSGFRFVREAARRELPIAIVNLGPTRGDPLATLVIDARAGELLPELAARLRARG